VLDCFLELGELHHEIVFGGDFLDHFLLKLHVCFVAG
jgi:hypothetical protein